MTSYSFNGEFSWEILYGVAEAYELHLSNNLDETNCVGGTKPFYYFSKNHKENQTRTSGPYKGPSYGAIYEHDTDISRLVFPPYKQHYGQLVKELNIPTNKQAVLINNKSCQEHENSAPNRISLDMLDLIVNGHKDRTIYYVRPFYNKDFEDDANDIPFPDMEYLRKFPNVVFGKDLMKGWNVDFNTMQLLLHSISDTFYSVAGGNAILSSFFGGTNNIFVSKKEPYNSREVWRKNSYLKDISGSTIKHFQTIDELQDCIDENQ
jgi:hypothetical protein